MIKGVIFDFDNTLYNYDNANNYALEFIMNDITSKFDINFKDVQQTYNKINKQIKNGNNSSNKFNKAIYFKMLFEFFKIPLKFLNDYVSLYNSKFMEVFKLYDGVIELFRFLKSKDIKIGILSNNIFFQQYIKLFEGSLIEYVDVIQTSDECGEEKPSKYMFFAMQHKMKLPFDQLAYVGDNYEHDIEPSIELGILPFWFNETHDFKLLNKVIHVGSFVKIQTFFNDYFKNVNELVFLSKYFGQSLLNVQGPGGNISVKLDDFLFIKSSGCILGNISYTDGYCIVDKNECDKMVKTNQNKITDAKIYGYKVPSMETYFHSFMKKYTIHLHFTPSNIYFCSNNAINLEDFKYNYAVIDFYSPGIELANEIYKCYTYSCDIYFLKNHGVIITASEMTDVIAYFEYIFDYFNKKLNNVYEAEATCFRLNQIYADNKLNVVVKIAEGMPVEIFRNMQICFPDMAVFVKNIIEIKALEDLIKNFVNYDVILYKNKVYCIADNITKLYSLVEILESYKTIYVCNNGNLSLIKNVVQIQNMPEEKYRNTL